MKALSSAIFILLFVICSAAGADDTSHKAAAEELLMLTKTDKMLEPLFGQMGQMMEKSYDQMGVTEEQRPLLKKYTEKLLKLLEEQLGWDNMKNDFITIYVETYTENEIRDISAFYKSPAGQKYIDKMPVLMQKSMEISQRNMPEMIRKMQQITAEMTQEMQNEISNDNSEGSAETQPKDM